MTNPCVPDCPERSSTCHAKCPKYGAFAKKRAEELKQKHNHSSSIMYISDATKRKRDRDAKRKNYR